MVGVNFFFDLFSQSGLRAFFTSDFANCTTDYAPTIRCCSQHLMVGVIFFWPVLPFWTEGIFHKWFCQLYYKLCPSPKITPTIRCCEQHLMVGVNFFFLTCSPILDLGHFSQMILPIVLHSPKIMPNHQVLFTASDGWGYFFLTCSPILDLGHFSQVILPIVLQIMPQLSGAVHSIWWLGFSFYLFSHSGLRAFFTDDFAIVWFCQSTVYAQPPGAVHSIWWLGLFFFWPVLPFWT